MWLRPIINDHDPVVRVRSAGYLFITPMLHERSFTPVAGSTENLSAGFFSFEKSVIVVMGKKV